MFIHRFVAFVSIHVRAIDRSIVHVIEFANSKHTLTPKITMHTCDRSRCKFILIFYWLDLAYFQPTEYFITRWNRNSSKLISVHDLFSFIKRNHDEADIAWQTNIGPVMIISCSCDRHDDFNWAFFRVSVYMVWSGVRGRGKAIN